MKYQFSLDRLYQALKKARTQTGLTQPEVEKQLGLRPLTIRDYESGRLKLPVEIAAKLANLYNAHLEELLGLKDPEKRPHQFDTTFIELASLGIFKDISKMETMMTDPVLRAAIDQHEIKISDTIYDVLIRSLSSHQKKQLLLEIIKISNSLIAIDGKITRSELSFRNNLLAKYLCPNQTEYFKLSKKYFYEPYFPKKLVGALERPELKHFIVWLLFFLAASDNDIDYREEQYILELSEAIHLPKFNYEFIRNKFLDYLAKKGNK